jgi:hypothetical protein
MGLSVERCFSRGCFLEEWPAGLVLFCEKQNPDSVAHTAALQSCTRRFSNGLSDRAIDPLEIRYLPPGLAPAHPIFFDRFPGRKMRMILENTPQLTIMQRGRLVLEKTSKHWPKGSFCVFEISLCPKLGNPLEFLFRDVGTMEMLCFGNINRCIQSPNPL